MGNSPSRKKSGVEFDDLHQYYEKAEKVGTHWCVKNNKVVVQRSDTVEVVNNYRVLGQLGKGRYGEVYLCTCNKRKKSSLFGGCLDAGDEAQGQNMFAMKVVRRQHSTTQEFKILMKVQHPGIVTLVEYIDDVQDPFVYLIFEHLEGGTIGECTNYGTLVSGVYEESRAIPLFVQILEALTHLHAMGVFHRDIKPENVVFASPSRQQVKLIDFGESRMLVNAKGGLAEESSRCTKGTPFFMACEALSGKKFPDKEGDTWAVGVLFYLLLVGNVPFGSGESSTIRLHDCIQTQKLKFPAEQGLSDGAKFVLTGMLDRDISRRFTLPFVLNHEWMKGGKGQVALFESTNHQVAPSPLENPLILNSSFRSGQGPHSPYRKSYPRQSFTDTPEFGSMKCSPGLQTLLLDPLPECTTMRDVCSTSLRGESLCESHLGSMLLCTKRMLICDDQPQLRSMLMKFLDLAKVSTVPLEYVESHTGETAIEQVLESAGMGEAFDLVIMDIYPYAARDQNGLDLLSQLRDIEHDRGMSPTPVLLSTTQGEEPENMLERAHELDAGFLYKPFSPAQACDILKHLGLRCKELSSADALRVVRDTHIADSHYVENAIARPGTICTAYSCMMKASETSAYVDMPDNITDDVTSNSSRTNTLGGLL